jgi:succinate-acetate transporter protein
MVCLIVAALGITFLILSIAMCSSFDTVTCRWIGTLGLVFGIVGIGLAFAMCVTTMWSVTDGAIADRV